MPEYVNAAYYPSWKVYKGKTPSSLDVDNLTHIFYAFVRVNEDGSLRLLDEWGDLHKDVDGFNGCLQAFANLKKRFPHIKTIVSIGGGSGSAEFPKLASCATSRRTFASQLLEFCNRHNFDGVDIDWEHPLTCKAGEDYVKLLVDVRSAFPSPQYLLTSALPMGEYCLRNIDLTHVSILLDYINLMGYDFTGHWTDVAGHHAQLFPPSQNLSKVHPTLRRSCSGGVEYALSHGVPPENILLGVPVYARYFTQAQGPEQPFSEAGEIDYCDIPEEWIQNAKVNEETSTASHVDIRDGKGFASFDVPRTVEIKARYAKNQGLGGLFYWTGVGDCHGKRSLVFAGNRILNCDPC